MKITVVGTGYVGLSNAMLFSKQHEVTALDIDATKIDKLNQGISPIHDDLIQEYLIDNSNFKATLDKNSAYVDAEVIIIATPTNYDEASNYFDTSSIESVLEDLNQLKSDAIIVVKSTIPVGFTERMKETFPVLKIVFLRNFCVKARHCTTTCIPHGLW